ncbi:hypothetical protein LUZ60_001464 [Juncus effusus]|nr:hypothetical protein LUZ60_001464 [Juncus effusus]
MAAIAAAESSTDGPVLSVISKRLRALRKKHNRILQMEESLSAGKILNKEQEEVLRSKPIVVALIDELEKLKSPLTSALAEELQQIEKEENQNQNQSQNENEKQKEADLSEKTDEQIAELLKLVYFGSLFDVKAQGEFTSMMLTRSHERGCCLTYDYVTDDEVDLLKEKDLDMMALMSSLLTSRPVTEGVSHKSALEACVAHAKLWLANSDQLIHPQEGFTYAGLKEKLKKIMGSEYFTTRPEMKVPVEVAAAVGHLQISEPAESFSTEGDLSSYENKEQQENSSHETHLEPQVSPLEETLKTNETESPDPSSDFIPVRQNTREADVANQVHGEWIPKGQQQHSPRRYNQNSRGGGRGGSGVAGQTGRRSFSNGGRTGGGARGGPTGGYSNGGRGRQYTETNYQPKGYYGNNNGGGRGGGGRFAGAGNAGGGMGNNNNNSFRGVNGGNGQPQAS